MKKLFTLLSLLLLTAAGAQAVVKYTVTVGPSTGEFYRVDGTQNASRWAARFVSNDSPVVTIATTENKFTVYRDGFGTYSGSNPLTWTISVEDGCVITGYKIVGTTSAGSCTLTPDGGEAVTFSATEAELSVTGLDTQSTTFVSARTAESATAGTDVNLMFTTYEVYVEDPNAETPLTVTYKVLWDGAQVATGTAYHYADDAAALPASLRRAFCTYEYSPATIADDTEEVTVTATWSGPFEIAPSFDEASWYTLLSNRSTYMSYEDGAADNVAASVEENDKADKLLWAFTGNPYDGFTVYNKAAGADNILGSDSGTTGSKYNKASHVSMAAAGTRVSEKWYLSSVNDGITFGDGSGYELNVRDDMSYLAYYNAGDVNNPFVPELVSKYFPVLTSEVNSANYTYYTSSGSTGGQWNATLVSNTAPELRVEVRDVNGNLAGNVFPSTTNFVFYAGQNRPSTYTISCPNGYELVSYTLAFNSTTNKTITPTEGIGTIDQQDDGTTVTINVTDINATSASFLYSGENDGLTGTLTIRYHQVSLPAYVTYVVLDADGTEIARYEDVEVLDGEEITELPAAYRKPFMQYDTNGPLTASSDAPVTLTATEAGYKLPFTVSTEGNETWYILKAGSYYSYNGGKGTSYDGRGTNYYYAFFGSPETGFTVKNGEGQFITGFVDGENAWSTPITMTDEGSVFTLEEAEGGFRLYTPHQTVEGRDLYLGYYVGYPPFTVWADLKNSNDGLLHAIPVGITDLAELSNEKCYTLTTERGQLGTKEGTLASTVRGAANGISEAGTFAIIDFEGTYYLWSVADGKFVVGEGSTSDEPAEAVTFTGNAPFLGKLGANGINIYSGAETGVVINSWTAADQGNMYAIEEAGDFDPTEALEKLYAHFLPQLYDTMKDLPVGTGLNEYGVSEDSEVTAEEAALTIATVGMLLENEVTSSYKNAYEALAELRGNFVLNLPEAGKFLRVYSVEKSGYVSSTVDESVDSPYNTYFTDNNEASDAGTIFYYDNDRLLNYGTAHYAAGVVNAALDAEGDTYAFSEATNGVGKYWVKPSSANYWYAGNPTLDYWSTPATATNTLFTLEYVEELPVTVTDAGWATLYLPVAVEIPEGVKAYVGKIEGDVLNFSEVTGVLPAGVPVILEAEAGDYTFVITDEEGSVDEDYDALIGVLAARTCDEGEFFTLQEDETDGIGMYPSAETELQGFKAYISAALAGSASGFAFVNPQTGIGGVEAAGTRTTIHDLQGRRVQQAGRGVYVVNGKKVMF